MQWAVSKPSSGSIIRVNMGFYYHYGIFVDENCIVQFGLPDNINSNPEEVEVLTTNINDFLNGEFLEVAKYTLSEHIKKRKDSEIVKYALGKLGTRGYNILENNCEHFVKECAFVKK